MVSLKRKMILASVLVFLSMAGLIVFSTSDHLSIFKSFLARKQAFKPVVPVNQDSGSMGSDLIEGGLPGQPFPAKFKQYSGYVTVDELLGRNLFYYFVEAAGPISRPVILWLNGGPGCSSLNGAFLENGPFQVRRDGRKLSARQYSWNKVSNIIYLESPAGVGFSYSNTTSDYDSSGDQRTAQDSYVFLIKWFQRFPLYQNSDFYIFGESYAGYYIPELAELILQDNKHTELPSRIQLKGVMIGNGMMNSETDRRGVYDYMWTHALISDQTYHGLIKNCMESILPECLVFQTKATQEMETTNVYNLYSPYCFPNAAIKDKEPSGIDPCEKNYVNVYLNLPKVQKTLHANTTKLPYAWESCSFVIKAWGDMPLTMLPLYRRLIAAGIRILVYSGDVDAVIPVTSTRYSINALNLPIRKNWHPWFDGQQVAGFRVEYEGLTFMTVLGAGHEVPRFQPSKAFSLLKFFLEAT